MSHTTHNSHTLIDHIPLSLCQPLHNQTTSQLQRSTHCRNTLSLPRHLSCLHTPHTLPASHVPISGALRHTETHFAVTTHTCKQTTTHAMSRDYGIDIPLESRRSALLNKHCSVVPGVLIARTHTHKRARTAALVPCCVHYHGDACSSQTRMPILFAHCGARRMPPHCCF